MQVDISTLVLLKIRLFDKNNFPNRFKLTRTSHKPGRIGSNENRKQIEIEVNPDLKLELSMLIMMSSNGDRPCRILSHNIHTNDFQADRD